MEVRIFLEACELVEIGHDGVGKGTHQFKVFAMLFRVLIDRFSDTV